MNWATQYTYIWPAWNTGLQFKVKSIKCDRKHLQNVGAQYKTRGRLFKVTK